MIAKEKKNNSNISSSKNYEKILENKSTKKNKIVKAGDIWFCYMPGTDEEISKIAEGHKKRPYYIYDVKEEIYGYYMSSNAETYKKRKNKYMIPKNNNVKGSKDSFIDFQKSTLIPVENLIYKMFSISKEEQKNVSIAAFFSKNPYNIQIRSKNYIPKENDIIILNEETWLIKRIQKQQALCFSIKKNFKNIINNELSVIRGERRGYFCNEKKVQKIKIEKIREYGFLIDRMTNRENPEAYTGCIVSLKNEFYLVLPYLESPKLSKISFDYEPKKNMFYFSTREWGIVSSDISSFKKVENLKGYEFIYILNNEEIRNLKEQYKKIKIKKKNKVNIKYSIKEFGCLFYENFSQKLFLYLFSTQNGDFFLDIKNLYKQDNSISESCICKKEKEYLKVMRKISKDALITILKDALEFAGGYKVILEDILKNIKNN